MTENETETSDGILYENIGMGNTQEDADSDFVEDEATTSKVAKRKVNTQPTKKKKRKAYVKGNLEEDFGDVTKELRKRTLRSHNSDLK